MQLLGSVLSIVSDASHKDKQLRNLTTQLNYVLEKAKKLCKKFDVTESQSKNLAFIRNYIQSLIDRAEKVSLKMQDLFSAENISLKQKIRLSLPFDKTKDQIKQLIQSIEKAYSDLKQQVDSLQTTTGPLQGTKRPLKKPCQATEEVEFREISSHTENQQQDDDSMDDMGPTINQDDNNKGIFVQAVFQLQGEQKILNIVKQKSPELLSVHIKQQIEDNHEILLYSLGRKDYRKPYKQLITIFPDIDRISKENHFQIIWRRTQMKINAEQTLSTKPSMEKLKHDLISSSKKHQNHDDLFFSFPEEIGNSQKFVRGIILLKKQSSKNCYVLKGDKWTKCQQNQVQLSNGDSISAFINNQEKSPLHLQVKYTLPNTK